MKFGVCRGLDDFESIKYASEIGLDYYECGFGSTAYFISVFKAKYGTTPGKYMSEKR